MKWIVLFCTLIIFLAFSYSRSIQTPAPAAKKATFITYESHIVPLIQLNCAPCHFPKLGGKKKSLDNYQSVRTRIDEILRRIQLNPDNRKFMPTKLPKLTDSMIHIFKQWKMDGLPEK